MHAGCMPTAALSSWVHSATCPFSSCAWRVLLKTESDVGGESVVYDDLGAFSDFFDMSSVSLIALGCCFDFSFFFGS
jgi:hypothetical protein